MQTQTAHSRQLPAIIGAKEHTATLLKSISKKGFEPAQPVLLEEIIDASFLNKATMRPKLNERWVSLKNATRIVHNLLGTKKGEHRVAVDAQMLTQEGINEWLVKNKDIGLGTTAFVILKYAADLKKLKI